MTSGCALSRTPDLEEEFLYHSQLSSLARTQRTLLGMAALTVFYMILYPSGMRCFRPCLPTSKLRVRFADPEFEIRPRRSSVLTLRQS